MKQNLGSLQMNKLIPDIHSNEVQIWIKNLKKTLLILYFLIKYLNFITVFHLNTQYQQFQIRKSTVQSQTFKQCLWIKINLYVNNYFLQTSYFQMQIFLSLLYMNRTASASDFLMQI